MDRADDEERLQCEGGRFNLGLLRGYRIVYNDITNLARTNSRYKILFFLHFFY